MGRLTRDELITAALLAWGGAELRDLPWRRTNDPWLVLVSEVMLQQTSVARVLPKYETFIATFPTPASLADAPLGDALQLWQGLGYPRRCRNLREAAIAVVRDHGGELPCTIEGMLSLPGVGQYTARAVLAFAHSMDVAVVDTNVSRVLSRLAGRPMKAKELQERADELVPSGSAWEWNQVMMDLGARVCVARTPKCGECPVRGFCTWKGDAAVEDPAPSSAGASKPQARFEGSDRQARGRAMRALNEGSRSRRELVAAMSLAEDVPRAMSLIDALVREGLVVEESSLLRLP